MAEDSDLVLLCYDGSDDAAAAIASAATLLRSRHAIVLTAWEEASSWEPFDPATILGAGVSKLAAEATGIDEIVADIAKDKLAKGVELARAAGFAEATGRIGCGRAWRVICDVAEQLDAGTIVLGARGQSRLESVLVGSVCSAVIAHTGRPVLVIENRSKPSAQG
jgi:nucleotide-binding universal stress UspA family protein